MVRYRTERRRQMKKNIALAALLAAGLALGSCSMGESIAPSGQTVTESKPAQTTAAPETTAPVTSSAPEESSVPVVETNGEYTKEYSEKIAQKAYSLDALTSSAHLPEKPMIVKVNGDDLYVKMSMGIVEVEVCQKDGKAYNLLPNLKSYSVSEATTLEKQGVTMYALPENARYVGNEMKDGLIVEVYEFPGVAVKNETDVEIDLPISYYQVRYYYSADKQLKKISLNDPVKGETTVTVNSLTFEDVSIELPDLTGWTEMNDSQQLDKVSSIKLALAIYGVTEEMVTKAGYTYEQIAEMDEEQATDVLVKIAEDNGLDFKPAGAEEKDETAAES